MKTGSQSSIRVARTSALATTAGLNSPGLMVEMCMPFSIHSGFMTGTMALVAARMMSAPAQALAGSS